MSFIFFYCYSHISSKPGVCVVLQLSCTISTGAKRCWFVINTDIVAICMVIVAHRASYAFTYNPVRSVCYSDSTPSVYHNIWNTKAPYFKPNYLNKKCVSIYNRPIIHSNCIVVKCHSTNPWSLMNEIKSCLGVAYRQSITLCVLCICMFISSMGSGFFLYWCDCWVGMGLRSAYIILKLYLCVCYITGSCWILHEFEHQVKS